MADGPTRSMTYGELASVLGIARESARHLVNRKRWARRKGNDGKARIEVPEEALPRPPTAGVPSDSTGAVAALARQLERLEKELEVARAALDHERARALALELDASLVPMLRTAVDALKGALETERAALRELRSRPSRSWFGWRRTA